MPPVLAALAALGACAGSRPDLGSESRPLGLDEGRLSALGANASKPLEERTYNFQPIGQTCNFLNSWCKLTPGKTLRPGLQVGSFEKRVTEGYLIKVYSDFNDAKDAAEEMKEFTSKKIRHSVAFCQYGTLSYTYGPFFINWKEVRHALVLQEGEPKGDAQLSEGLENVAFLKDKLAADAKLGDDEKKVKPEVKKKLTKALCEFGTDMKQHKLVLHDLGANILTEIKKPKTIVVVVLPGEFEKLKDEEEGEEQRDAVKDVEAFLQQSGLGESCEQT